MCLRVVDMKDRSRTPKSAVGRSTHEVGGSERTKSMEIKKNDGTSDSNRAPSDYESGGLFCMAAV
ncbi:MAG: hypothetical protein ACI9N9_001254 [Enterobacterales bacterium]|jgi:hypothetical protein